MPHRLYGWFRWKGLHYKQYLLLLIAVSAKGSPRLQAWAAFISAFREMSAPCYKLEYNYCLFVNALGLWRVRPPERFWFASV